LWNILQKQDQASAMANASLEAAMQQYMGGCVMWVLEMEKAMEVLGFNAKDCY
jgi:hypothetical protein